MTTATEPTCPKCGGAMWNNIATKTNPKAPDFKCRDKACDGVIWPPKPGQRSPVSPPPAHTEKQAFTSGPALPYENVETGAPPTSPMPRLDALFNTYGTCLDEAIRQAKKLDTADIGSTPEAVASIAATLFIAASR